MNDPRRVLLCPLPVRISIVLGISHSRRESRLLLIGELFREEAGDARVHRDRLHAHAAHTHLPAAAAAAAASPEGCTQRDVG